MALNALARETFRGQTFDAVMARLIKAERRDLIQDLKSWADEVLGVRCPECLGCMPGTYIHDDNGLEGTVDAAYSCCSCGHTWNAAAVEPPASLAEEYADEVQS